MSYLIDIADRFIFLRQGQIIWEKSSQEVQALPSTELERYGLREVNPVSFSAKESDGLQDRTHAVDIHNLSFAYDRTCTTADLTIESLSIPSGAIVGIVGNNGAGKTTLARCICGLEKKNTGDLCFFGQKRNHKQRLKETYLVMQDVNHQLFASSVADEVELSMRFSKQDKAVQSQYRVSEILKRLNLEEYAQVHPVSLSGGQKQRVAIAGALAAQRKIVVFDEPTSGLDRIHMQQTAALLAELAGQGITCLVITHDPELIQTCCNWIIAMEEGSVSFSRPFDSLCATMLAEFFYAER